MSGPSESDSSDHEGSAASFNESELSDTRKRRSNKQIQGKAWILRGEISTNLLHNDSDPASIDVDANDEDAKVQNTKSLTEAALGAKFESLFRNMYPHVNFFVFFGNLVNILHAGPVSAATKITIQIRGFLQLGKRNLKNL
jgi:hypothetical protein